MLVSASDSFPLRQRQIDFDDILEDPDETTTALDQIAPITEVPLLNTLTGDQPSFITLVPAPPIQTTSAPADPIDDVAPIIDRPIFDPPSGTTSAPAEPTNPPEEAPDESEELSGLCGALTQEIWEENGMPSRVTEYGGPFGVGRDANV
jgi:hypothetical protein